MMRCAICRTEVTDEAPPVLTYGGAGQARVLCPDCDGRLSCALEGTDAADVRDALRALSELRLLHGDVDRACSEVLSDLTARAAERLSALEDGTLTQATGADAEDAEEAPVEVPEELCESEEDRALDRAEEEREREINGYMKYVYIGALIGVVTYLIYFIFFR